MKIKINPTTTVKVNLLTMLKKIIQRKADQPLNADEMILYWFLKNGN